VTEVDQARNPLDEGYSVLEEVLHSLTHGVGAGLSIAGMVVLIVFASLEADVWKIVSFSIYGASLALLYLASTLYHAVTQPKLKRAFKMWDHCAIFLLIAGTYTPFLLVNLRGPLGWSLFGVVWGLAVAGVAFKLIFGHRHQVLQLVIYLGMGWLIVFASSELAARINGLGLSLIIAGGVTYTLGVIFYAVRRIPFNHAIWHLFVMGGSVCHFFAIYYGVLKSPLT